MNEAVHGKEVAMVNALPAAGRRVRSPKTERLLDKNACGSLAKTTEARVKVAHPTDASH